MTEMSAAEAATVARFEAGEPAPESWRWRICLRYQEVRGDRLAFSCECAGEGCPDQTSAMGSGAKPSRWAPRQRLTSDTAPEVTE